MGKKLTTEEFIERAKKKHGNRYDYSLVMYIHMHSKITIKCFDHGEFNQSPNNHLKGNGCPTCVGKGYIKNYSINNIPRYELYQPRLEPYGVKCRRSPQDTNILEVKCMYCDKWHQPTRHSVVSKISCVKGGCNYKGEQNLYCSDGCKQECPTYRQVLYPKSFKKDTSREVQPALRKLVLERDNWTCQKCDSQEDGLHCHHIEGIEINPVESADIDMCVTLCKDCHNKLHKRDDCNMRRKKCK